MAFGFIQCVNFVVKDVFKLLFLSSQPSITFNTDTNLTKKRVDSRILHSACFIYKWRVQ